MSTAPPPPRLKPKQTRFTKDKPPASAPKIVLYAPEGWGKTSFGCYAHNAAIIQCGETGYDTLVNAGRVPIIYHDRANNWAELLSMVDELIADPRDISALTIDALGVIERWIQEVVVERDYKGNWNDPKEGFRAWGQSKGNDSVAAELNLLLSRLERLAARGVSIVILSHVRLVTRKNADAADIMINHPDICVPAGYQLIRWADAILYGEYVKHVMGGDYVQEGKAPAKKGKGVSEPSERVIHTEHNTVFVAKNRYGMPAEIPITCAPDFVWETVATHIYKGA